MRLCLIIKSSLWLCLSDKYQLSKQDPPQVIINKPYLLIITWGSIADYYLKYVCQYLTDYFPNLVSYNRMVELMPNALTACLYYLSSRRGQVTGISFVDSTAIPVCHPKRITRNKVFQETAKLSKSSMGWFFGFKLHLIINRSLHNFMLNLITALIAYTHRWAGHPPSNLKNRV